MAQKTDGNMDDVRRVVHNIKEGMPWHNAKVYNAFLAVEDSWYERNKALLYQWADTGIPTQQDNISLTDQKPDPFQILSTPDGKVWAVYKEKDGFRRVEIEASAPLAQAAAPVPTAVEEPAKSEKPRVKS
jgi:hypothetical protein